MRDKRKEEIIFRYLRRFANAEYVEDSIYAQPLGLAFDKSRYTKEHNDLLRKTLMRSVTKGLTKNTKEYGKLYITKGSIKYNIDANIEEVVIDVYTQKNMDQFMFGRTV